MVFCLDFALLVLLPASNFLPPFVEPETLLPSLAGVSEIDYG